MAYVGNNTVKSCKPPEYVWLRKIKLLARIKMKIHYCPYWYCDQTNTNEQE